jgi:hypothetical protein
MSDTKKTGGPAYPVPNDANVNGQEGMTLRDHFAGLAMQGTLANEARLAIIAKEDGLPAYALEMQDRLARRCYSMADAMIKARKQ